MNNDTKKYLADIKQLLYAKTPSRKILLKNLAQSIDSYTLEHPHFTYDDLVQNFGTPTDIAESYYESLNSKEIYKKTFSKKAIVIGISILLLGIILLIALKVRYDYYLNREIPTYTIEEYEELQQKGILP